MALSAYVERARWGVWDAEVSLLHQAYVECVVAAGGLPVVVPPYADGAAEVLRRVDALVLAGGPDLDPARYGQAAHPRTGAPRVPRDEAELALLRVALDRDMPVLGVCRGMEALNVACGGSLVQHLPEIVDHDGHQPEPGVFGHHTVQVADGSLLADALGAREAKVASYHHQGLDRIGVGLQAVAWASDGSVEAVEAVDGSSRRPSRFVVGVLWHPEETRDVRLFAALVDAARGAVGERP